MTTSFALLAIRIWWLLVAVLAVVGAACGYYAVKDTPYQSTSTLRVDTAGYDEVSQKSIVETARILVDSNRTYSLIAGNDSAKIEALRQRTTVEVQLNSSVLLITVTDRSSTQAEHDANALADTAIVNFQQLANEQFNKTVTSGQGALATGRLVDPVAEAARRQAVGQAIAAQQDTALRLSAELSRVGTVTPAVKVGLSGPIAALMGGLAGLFVGACAALVLGVGRRRIKRLADLETLAPTVARCEPIPMDGIARVAAESNRIMHPLVVVLSLRRAEDALEAVTESLRAELSRDGTRAFHLEHDEVRHMLAADRAAAVGRGPGAVSRQRTTAEMAAPTLGMPQRATDLVAVDADILLVTGRCDDRNLNYVASRADVVLLVCGWRRTRAKAVIEATRRLPMEPVPYVVLTDPPTRRDRGPASLSRSRTRRPVSEPGLLEPEVSEPVVILEHESPTPDHGSPTPEHEFPTPEHEFPTPEHELPTPIDKIQQAIVDRESPTRGEYEHPTLVDLVRKASVEGDSPTPAEPASPASAEPPSPAPADHDSAVSADRDSPTAAERKSPASNDHDSPASANSGSAANGSWANGSAVNGSTTNGSAASVDLDGPTLVHHPAVSLVHASRPTAGEETDPAHDEHHTPPAAATRPSRPRPTPRPRSSYSEMIRSVTAGGRGEG